MKLTIDVREKGERRGKVAQFMKEKGIASKEEQLPIGDYVFDRTVCFEYKTADDIINSIQDGRVFKQQKRMKQYKYNYILIVGDVFKEIRARQSYKKFGRAFTYENYLGALSSLSIAGKVIQVQNLNQACNLMYFLATTALKKSKFSDVVDKPVCRMISPVSTFLTCIEGIGAKQAVEVRDRLKLESLEDLTKITYDDLINIKGIGSKTANKIMEVIK